MALHQVDDGTSIVGVCVDSSEHSFRAFEWYRQHYHREGFKVAIVHVHCPPPLPTMPIHPLAGPVILNDKWIDNLEKSLEESREIMKNYKKRCEEFEIPYILVSESKGEDIGESILHAARKWKMSALIIGNRGLGTVRRTFLGSVSDYIVHHASCPVTVVPPL